MRFFFIFLCLFMVSFIWNLPINALNHASSHINPSKKELPRNISLEKSLLWEVTGNGLKKPSYIFGTIHIICEEDFFWKSQFEKALNNVDEIIFEVDYNYVIKYYYDLFDSDILKKYYDRYEDFGKPDKQFESIKSKIRPERFRSPFNNSFTDDPFQKIRERVNLFNSLANYFSEKPVAIDFFFDNCDDIISYEIKLIEMGLTKGKTFGYMESVEEQLEALDSKQDSYRSMKEKLESRQNKETHEEKIKRLVDLYVQQDIMALYSFMIRPDMGVVDLDAVLFDRNIKWVHRLSEKLLSGKSLFVAVGAGHLASEKGLINLLRKEGYVVRPVFGNN